MPRVVVELYGVARLRAGVAEVVVEAAMVGSALVALATAYPALGVLTPTGRLASHYLLSLDGGEFVLDLGRDLTEGSRLVLLSADAGG